MSSRSATAKSRCPRTAASFEVTCSSERPVRSPEKTMWTMCFAAMLRSGAIESAIAIGPSSGSSASMPTSSSSSLCRASARLSPASTPPPGRSQYSLPGFSCRQSRMRSSHRSSAETRIRGCIRPTAEPAGAALAVGELVDLDELDVGNREHDELRDPHAGLDHERLARIGVQEVDEQLAAIPGVDEAGRVHDRDPVLRRETGARLDVAGVALRDRDREPCRDQGALPRRELDPLARGEVDACITRVRPARHLRVGPETPDRELDHTAFSCAASATRNSAKRRISPCGSRACTSTPSSVSSLPSIGAPSEYSSASFAPSSYGTSSLTGSNRSRKRDAMRARSSSSPSPVLADTCSASG